MPRSRTLLLIFFALLTSCNNMPYGLKIINFKTIYSINDREGYPIISEQYHINGIDTNPKVEKLIKYTKNDLGLVVMISTETGDTFYVAIIPKTKQFYAELDVTYTIYTKLEYSAMKLNDRWITIEHHPYKYK